ncbi:MAG: hypothetical protein IPH20_18960 [Bacteroidales bacterium]|nr:hypothetical protein [Bacteroidales bacterium]
MKNSNSHPISWQNSAITSVLLTMILLISNGLSAQIYPPEGLNMPGAWNEWTNPPVNNLALASSTQVTGGRVTKILKAIPSGTDRYQTMFSAAESGGDISGGTHQWLFTSGSTSNPWGNKWGSVTVTMNTLQNYTFGGSAANSSITLTNGKWYTMNWKDSGYSGTQAIYMETSTLPADLTSVSVPASVPANQPETITLTTGSTPAVEELFYLLYTTNNWATSSIVPFFNDRKQWHSHHSRTRCRSGC